MKLLNNTYPVVLAVGVENRAIPAAGDHTYWRSSFLKCKWSVRLYQIDIFQHFHSFQLDFKCSNNQFRCTNGECVKKNLLCDGDYACKDRSDEESCACPTNMFQCKGGGCLPATALCDDTKQDGCDGEDEINCRKSPYFITCIVPFFPLPRAKKLKVNQ